MYSMPSIAMILNTAMAIIAPTCLVLVFTLLLLSSAD
jgi:hypothetical protein